MSARNVLIMISPMSPARLNGIARFARERRWNMMTTDRLLHRLSGWSGDGALVTLRNDPAQIRTVRSLMKRGIPVVDLTNEHPEINLPRVIGDHFKIGWLAGRHLIERNFAHLAWFSTAYTNIHDLRFRGLRESCGDRLAAKLVVSEALGERSRDDWLKIVHWLNAELSRLPTPLGIVCYDDSDAARIEEVCRSSGIAVPEDVAILGIGDDTFICDYQEVRLSSVIHDTEEIGYRGAALLARLMDGADKPEAPILIPPKGITVRASTDILATNDPTVRRALDYIGEHLGESFGIAQVATALGTSEIRLHRLFRKELNRRVGDEIRRQRIALAKTLLAETDLGIREIASQTGFCNFSHFTRTFRQTTGINPSVYRRTTAPTGG